MSKKAYSGIVVGLNSKKTAKVRVSFLHKLKKYPKQIRLFKTIQAHVDFQENEKSIKLGDRVTIESCRPRSKTKNFEVKEIENK